MRKSKQAQAVLTPATAKTTRVTLDLKPVQYERLNRLAVMLGLTLSATLRESMRLHETVALAHAEGSRFLIQKADGSQVELPFFCEQGIVAPTVNVPRKKDR